MNQYFSESISLDLLYRTLGMIIVENNIIRFYIFFIFGYVRNLYQKREGGGEWVQGLDGLGALT